jgi:ribosomal protein L19
MSQQILEMVEKASLKSEVLTFAIGDTLDVHTKILEGDKERIQIFTGVVIAQRLGQPGDVHRAADRGQRGGAHSSASLAED